MPKVSSAKEEGLMDGGFEGWMDGGFVGRWKQQMVDLKDGGFQGWMDGGNNGGFHLDLIVKHATQLSGTLIGLVDYVRVLALIII